MFRRTEQKIWSLVDDHLGFVYGCFCAFEVFMGDFLDGKRKSAESQSSTAVLLLHYRKIDELEGKADHARRKIIDAFLEGQLLPSTRKELLEITARMDKIANICQDIACKLVYENVDIPAEYRANLLEITRLTKEQYAMLKRALKILFDDFDRIIKDRSILDDIKKKESEIDTLEDDTTIAIFANEELDLAHKIQLKYFLDKLADISDLMEDIADQIQVIVVLRKV